VGVAEPVPDEPVDGVGKRPGSDGVGRGRLGRMLGSEVGRMVGSDVGRRLGSRVGSSPAGAADEVADLLAAGFGVESAAAGATSASTTAAAATAARGMTTSGTVSIGFATSGLVTGGAVRLAAVPRRLRFPIGSLRKRRVTTGKQT
jgi:hypothetical protein